MPKFAHTHTHKHTHTQLDEEHRRAEALVQRLELEEAQELEEPHHHHQQAQGGFAPEDSTSALVAEAGAKEDVDIDDVEVIGESSERQEDAVEVRLGCLFFFL